MEAPVSKGRLRIALFIVATSLVTGVATVAAEPAAPYQAKEDLIVRVKPGEKEDLVVKVPAGTAVKVEKMEGRWFKVRVGDKAGYVARTQLSGGPPADGGGSGVWSAPRHQGGREAVGLFLEVVGAQGATLRKEPAGTAPKVGAVAKGGRLAIVDATRPDWVQVRDEAGVAGWVARGEVDNGASSVSVTGVDLKGVSEFHPDEPDYDRPGRRLLRADAGLGYRSLGMTFSSAGTSPLANYLVAAATPTLVLGGDVQAGGRVTFGADAHLALGTSAPGDGINYVASQGGKIGFSTIDLNAGGRLGVRFGSAVQIAVRLGVRSETFHTSDVTNPGMLPSERLSAVTAGAQVEIVPPHSRVSASATLEDLVSGSRTQTAGLEDGAQSTAHALWAGLTFRYVLRPGLSVLGAFQFGRATTTWTGMSMRTPDVNGAQRVDTSQLVQLGLSAEL
jgi:uncharacterized protein YgiM (DUF1202 family)